MVGDFNTPLSPMDRPSNMKINKETQALNDILNKMDLIDIYRIFHPKTTECTFFSRAHGTFSRIDHILGHKSTLGKFKKTEIISNIFSNHNTMRLDINYRKKSVKNTNTWRLNNTLLNNQEIIQMMINICKSIHVIHHINKLKEKPYYHLNRCRESFQQNSTPRASLVAQWLRICLLMRGTRVRALVWEDPTCHGAAGPVSHNC